MHVLVGKSSKEDILKSISLLGKTLLPDQALFCIHNDVDQVEIKEVIQKEVEDIKLSKIDEIKPTISVFKSKDLQSKKWLSDVKKSLKKSIINSFFL